MSKKQTATSKAQELRVRSPRAATVAVPPASPVAGQMYTNSVVEGPLVHGGEECVGLCHNRDQRIEYMAEMASMEECVEVVMHEGIEALNTRYELNLTHQQITLLSEGLTPYWLSWILAQ